MKEPPKHILAIRLSALGDVAMTLPILYAVARKYPTLRITLLTRPFFGRLFINKPSNLQIIPWEKGVSTFRILKQVAALRPDAIADLHNVLRSWTIDTFFRLKGVPVVMVDKKREERRRITSGGKQIELERFTDRYAGVFARLGYPVEPDFVSLFAEQTLPEAPIEILSPAIGIAPFARYYTKTYPIDQMKEVVRLLSERGYHIYLFGGKNEAATFLPWVEAFPQVHSLAGAYGIEEELFLMSQMNLMVSMDSANQHLASLVGIPALTIWGGTTPECGFLGYGQSVENTLCLHLDCQPCSIAGTPHCKKQTLACMREISPGIIVEKILQMSGRSSIT